MTNRDRVLHSLSGKPALSSSQSHDFSWISNYKVARRVATAFESSAPCSSEKNNLRHGSALPGYFGRGAVT
jgi:hypothetical protein